MYFSYRMATFRPTAPLFVLTRLFNLLTALAPYPSRGAFLFAYTAYQYVPTRVSVTAPYIVLGPWRIRSLKIVPHCRTAIALLYSTPPYTLHSAVLRDISGGTSYQTVRLVFRPYTQLTRSI